MKAATFYTAKKACSTESASRPGECERFQSNAGLAALSNSNEDFRQVIWNCN